MLFKIHASTVEGDKQIFEYDNMSNILKNSDGVVFKFTDDTNVIQNKPAVVFDRNTPLKKSKLVTTLKIQLGLSCNYSCDYCSQKFVERAAETNKNDVPQFMEKLENLSFDETVGLRVEFWGGEPLVYWKTLKPLAEAILEKFSDWKVKPVFGIITNGSILTDEMIDWLMMREFNVAISHDGPGQSVRGPDPFDDPEQKARILGFHRMMTRLGKGFSFNAMLHSKNKSRKEIYDWFVRLTGDENIVLGEGSLVDAYDEEGIVNSLNTLKEHFEFRQTAFSDIYTTDGNIGFFGQLQKVNGFIQSVLSQQSAVGLGQKCGMDDKHTIAVDLRGNVITCQNVSSLEVSKNDEPHLGGTLDDFENVQFTSVTHWSKRKECPGCPVLHLCKGACMFLDKKYWDISCANAYSDNVALFAAAIYKMTGFIPTVIESTTLPLDRQDVFGTVFEHKEKSKLSSIPIKVLHEKVGQVDGVDVYAKSRLE